MKKNLLTLFILASMTSANAASIDLFVSNVEFFASNNTDIIDPATAYQRVQGEEQRALQDNMLAVLQSNHLHQGRTEDVVAASQIEGDNRVTADNSEVFTSSPLQHLTEHKVFSVAKELATVLQQQSVAVFIPSKKAGIGDMTLKFTSQTPTISEAIAMLRDKLPPKYSQGYTLHLQGKCAEFTTAKVTSIEWLGSQTNYDEVKAVFPNEEVNYVFGKAYLVFKSGQKTSL